MILEDRSIDDFVLAKLNGVVDLSIWAAVVLITSRSERMILVGYR